jgi:23S rRNA pseudouridine1911/1915/1917 synthase
VRGEGATLAHGVAQYLRRKGSSGRVHAVHRLDRDTSGAVLFAKSAVVQHRFGERVRGGAGIEREYLALVQGVLETDRGRIDAPIGQHPTRRGLRVVQPKGGLSAATRFEIVERFPDATLLRARLETGRTHQIRVHLAHLGHPLIGDRAYGGRDREISRQALHACRLTFMHPTRSAELVDVSAPVPEDLGRAIERARTSRGVDG